MLQKFCTFSFVVGFILLIIYVGSDLAKNPQYELLFFSLGLILWGIWGMTKRSNPSLPNGRFGLLQQFRKGHSSPNQQEPKK